MDFLSNLIKRPISLVLNDSSSIVQQLSSPPSHSPPIERPRTPPPMSLPQNSSSPMASAMNTSISAYDSDGIVTDFVDTPVLSSGSNNCSSSTSSATSTTIEELLIQINDNLNQAGLGDEFIDHRSALSPKAELSPLASTKPMSAKMTPSPQAAQSTIPTAAVFGSASAAGSAVFEVNSTLNQFLIDPELEAGIFDECHHLDLDNNTNVKRTPNKFAGLTEFDESSIPELPGTSHTDIKDQVKLTFEDGLIPTLTANVHTTFDSPNKTHDTHRMHQLISNEHDTAVSSDNETFSECQSYHDTVNTTNDFGELAMEYSEAEAYRSALNSNNITTTNDTDPLNATMENVPEITDDISGEVAASTGENIFLNLHNNMCDITFEDDPMDVDMDYDVDMDLTPKTELVQTNCNQQVEQPDERNENSTSLNSSGKTIADLNPSSMENVSNLSNEAQLEIEPELESAHEVELPVDSNAEADHQQADEPFPVEHLSEAIAIATDDLPSESELEIQQSTHEHSLNKSIELPTNRFKKNFSNESIIQDNSVDSATDILPAPNAADLTQDIEATTSPKSINDEISSSAAKVEFDSQAASCSQVNAKLNLTLDMNSSFSSSKSSAPTSPTFPIKKSNVDKRHFPQSPSTMNQKKGAVFLESAESAQHINAAHSEMAESQQYKLPISEINIIPPSPEKPTEQPSETNLNETIDIAREKSPSPVPNEHSDILNGTFDGSSKPSESQTENKNKRLTFGITEAMQSELDEMEHKTSLNHSDMKRRTFNVSPSALKDKSNVSFEAMDIDETLPLTSPRAKSPPMENNQNEEDTINRSPPRSSSPPIPTLQKKQNTEDATKMSASLSSSPPIPTLQKNRTETCAESVVAESDNSPSPPISTVNKVHLVDEAASKMMPPPTRSPPIPSLQKRPPIHLPTDPTAVEMLSAKEQIKSDSKDEKDVFVEKFVPSPLEDMFAATASSAKNKFAGFGGASGGDDGGAGAALNQQLFSDEDFPSNNNFIFNPCDFDYLLTKGNNNVQVDRSSLLLRFDPLLGVPLPVNQPQQQQKQLQQVLAISNACLSPTIEEDEQHHNSNNRSFVVQQRPLPASESAKLKERSAEVAQELQQETQPEHQHQKTEEGSKPEKHVRMSVDVIKDMNIDNDSNKSFENSHSQLDEKQNNFKMDELEKKIRNEVLKTEDIEKKLKDAEQREEALIKRITEKDKTISKMNGVIEAYEKAIAELIAEKQQLIQSYEKQLAEVKSDRDSNYHHLTSLETTFSDLHVKYEKSKEMTSQLKSSEESLLAEKRQNLENLRLQEQRYEKMKNHAMQQLEIANRKLESLTKEHAIESTKLKALLKKEEISRASINEQLSQKSRENAELVKICDELINGQGS